MEDTIYLVGDVRYTNQAEILYKDGNKKAPVEFLLALQSIMEEFGVVKVDLSTDAFKYASCKKQLTQ